MTLDATRVTVLGGGRRKIVTMDRQGRTVDRYEVLGERNFSPAAIVSIANGSTEPATQMSSSGA